MSRLALDWVKKNFTFPRKVDNLEKDFSDGQLFLHVLRQRGLLSEEDAINEMDTPFAATENLQLLRRRLRAVDIHMEKADIANIMSEQPGASADVIMRMKGVLEVRDGLVKVRKNTLTAIRTNRPHEFKRESEEFRKKPAKERTLLQAQTKTREAGMSMLLSGYEEFKYIEDDRIQRDEELEYQRRHERHKDMRQTTLQKMRLAETRRREEAEEGHMRWKGNQKDKYNRSVRDLQFELALQTKQELQTVRVNRQHAAEQTGGIEFYEQNLRRNGFGGAGDDDEKLDVTYEDGDLFIKRLEETAQRTAPTDGEIGDFTMQLKNRTKELRIARQEKVRRKRRMIVSQLAAGSAAEQQEEIERRAAEEKRLEREAVAEEEKAGAKAAAKQAKNDEIAERARLERERVAVEAEEQLRIFSEQQIMLADDRDREAEYKRVLEAQSERKAASHIRNEKMIAGFVLEFVNEVLDFAESGEDFNSALSGTQAARSLAGTAGQPAADLPDMLCEYVRHRLDTAGLEGSVSRAGRSTQGAKKQLQLHDIAALDLWPPALSALSIIGLWTEASGEPVEVAKEAEPAGEDEPTGEENQTQADGDTGSPAVDAVSAEQPPESDDCPGGGAEVDAPTPESSPHTASPVSPSAWPVPVAEQTCSDAHRLFMDALISRLSTQGAGNGGAAADSGVSVEATTEEESFLERPVARDHLSWEKKLASAVADAETQGSPSSSRTIVVLGLEFDPVTASRIWENVAQWFHGKVAVWDVVKALEVTRLLKDASADGGSPSVVAVSSALFGESLHYKTVDGEDAASVLNSIELSAQVKKIIAELIVFYDRILNYREYVVRAPTNEDPDAAPPELPEAPFDNTTLAIMLFQSLWLRSTIFSVLEGNPAVESISQKVVVGGLWKFSKNSFDSAVISRAALWFSKGCVRLDLPDTETVLLAAVAKEAEREKFVQLPPGTKPPKAAKAPAKAAAKKGQVVELPYDKSPSVCAAIWHNTGNAAAVPSPPADNQLEVSVEQEVVEFYCKPNGAVDGGDAEAVAVDSSGQDTWLEFSKIVHGFDGVVPVYPLLHSSPAVLTPPPASDSSPADAATPEADAQVESPAEAVETAPAEGNPVTEIPATADVVADMPSADADAVPDDTPVSTPVGASVYLKCPTLIALSEACAASVLDSCGYMSAPEPQSADAPPDAVEATEAVAAPEEEPEESPEERDLRLKNNLSDLLSRVTNIVELRRSRLDFLDRVWLNHLSGANVLTKSSVVEAAEAISQCKANELELMTPLLMGLMYKIQDLDVKYRKKKAFLINLMKASDPRWQSICMKYFGKLSRKEGLSLSAADIDDMNCLLGDVIDQRHFEWSNQATRIIEDATREYSAVVEYVIDLSSLLARSSMSQLQCLQASARALSAVLDDASYLDTPWRGTQYLEPYAVKSRGGALRMAFDLRQDDLRANASHINVIGSKISEWKSQQQENYWRDFASTDLPNASAAAGPDSYLSALSIPIVQDLHFEHFGKALCIQKTLLTASENALGMLNGLKEFLASAMHKRNMYEHATLKLWTSDLLSTPEGEDPKLYYFDTPGDSSLDQIEWVSGTGCIDLQEMVLPLSVILEVAKDVYEVLAAGVDQTVSESVIVNGKVGDDTVPDILCSVLVSAATLCVDRGVVLPDAWKQPSKLRTYAEHICITLPIIGKPISLRDLIRYVIARQIYGFVPSVPSSSYLSVMVKTLGLDIPESATKIPLKALLYKLSCNPKLPAGWWDVPKRTTDSAVSSLDKIKMRSMSRNGGTRGGSGSLHTLTNGTISSASNVSLTVPSTGAYDGDYPDRSCYTDELYAEKAGLWALECIAWTCIDSASADVDVMKLLYTLSVYPSDITRLSAPLATRLVSVVDAEYPVDLNLSHAGLGRATAISALVHRQNYMSDDESLLRFNSREKLSSLLGPNLSAEQFKMLFGAIEFAATKDDEPSACSSGPVEAPAIKMHDQFLYKELDNGDLVFCRGYVQLQQASDVMLSFCTKNGEFNLFDI